MDRKIHSDISELLEKPKKRACGILQQGRSICKMAMKKPIMKLSVVVLMVFIVVILMKPFGSNHNVAYAQVLEQVEKAKTMTWKETYYVQSISKDGQRKWIDIQTRQCAYKSPGLYRIVYDATIHGQVRHEVVVDTINLKKLTLNVDGKQAILSEIAFPIYDPRGPFTWQEEYIKGHDLEWVGSREVKSGEVNLFRSSFRDRANNEDWSYDFWIDVGNKKLVSVQIPGANIYDPEKDPTFNNTPEKDWCIKEPLCTIMHDIKLDVKLDESLFRFEVPQDYTIQTEQREQVPEEQAIDFLGALAEYYDGVFPDQLFPFLDNFSDELNEIEGKAECDRTAIEQRLIEMVNYYKLAGLYMLPITHFLEDHTIEKSFRYLGKGVSLGDKDRIICWYRPKNSKTFRVVYGDLSVTDIEPENIPLMVDP
jgi:hypothetical protein